MVSRVKDHIAAKESDFLNCYVSQGELKTIAATSQG